MMKFCMYVEMEMAVFPKLGKEFLKRTKLVQKL